MGRVQGSSLIGGRLLHSKKVLSYKIKKNHYLDPPYNAHFICLNHGIAGQACNATDKQLQDIKVE